MTQLAQERERNRMWQNRSVIILAAIILAIIIVGWVVQLAGGLQRPVSQSDLNHQMSETGLSFSRAMVRSWSGRLPSIQELSKGCERHY
jgi:hypothetical protein